jgi:CBS domain containing-hemolysin-like protein
MLINLLLMLAAVCFVMLSGLFSGAETGMYQLSLLRLRLGVEQKRLSFMILARLLRDRGTLLISMLLGTNLSCYLTTITVTLLLLKKSGSEHTAEFLATVIITPTLFVFSELIPKTIFFYRSDALMHFIAPVLFVFKKIFTFCGILPFLQILSRFFAFLTGSPLPAKTAATAIRSSYIKMLFKETQEEEVFSPVQTDIINRLTNISDLTLRSVMIGFGKVQMIEQNSDRDSVLGKLKVCSYTRLLVYKDHPANIVGFVNVYECLSTKENFSNLENFIKPIRRLYAKTNVIEAINIMRREKLKVILVTKSGYSARKKAIGIATMKDLVEELLGELAEW